MCWPYCFDFKNQVNKSSGYWISVYHQKTKTKLLAPPESQKTLNFPKQVKRTVKGTDMVAEVKILLMMLSLQVLRILEFGEESWCAHILYLCNCQFCFKAAAQYSLRLFCQTHHPTIVFMFGKKWSSEQRCGRVPEEGPKYPPASVAEITSRRSKQVVD